MCVWFVLDVCAYLDDITMLKNKVIPTPYHKLKSEKKTRFRGPTKIWKKFSKNIHFRPFLCFLNFFKLCGGQKRVFIGF